MPKKKKPKTVVAAEWMWSHKQENKTWGPAVLTEHNDADPEAPKFTMVEAIGIFKELEDKGLIYKVHDGQKVVFVMQEATEDKWNEFIKMDNPKEKNEWQQRFDVIKKGVAWFFGKRAPFFRKALGYVAIFVFCMFGYFKWIRPHDVSDKTTNVQNANGNKDSVIFQGNGNTYNNNEKREPAVVPAPSPPELPAGCKIVTVTLGATTAQNPIQWPAWNVLAGSPSRISAQVRSNKFYVDALVTLDGIYSYAITNMVFRGDMPPTWDRNWSANAFEIVGPDGLPVFQLFYKQPEHVVISGLFPWENGMVMGAFGNSISTGPIDRVLKQFPNRRPLFKYPAWQHRGEYAAATKDSESEATQPSAQVIANSPGAMQAGRDINVNTQEKTTGALKPHYASLPEEQAGTDFQNRTVSTRGGNFGTMSFGDVAIGTTILPFGSQVPLSIKKTSEGVLLSGEFKSLDGKIVAEMVDNEWRVNPKNYFKLNYDGWALEVIDEYNIPWLQVEYLTPQSIRVGGVFRSQTTSWKELHPNMTNVAGVANCVIGPRMIAIVGNGINEMRGAPQLETDIQRDAFATEVREIVKPWFDYTPSKGLGVRLPK